MLGDFSVPIAWFVEDADTAHLLVTHPFIGAFMLNHGMVSTSFGLHGASLIDWSCMAKPKASVRRKCRHYDGAVQANLLAWAVQAADTTWLFSSKPIDRPTST